MLTERASQMVIFYYLIRNGSFTIAAKQLGVSVSHVSKQIVKLEAELNVKLVQRTTRTVSATPAGEQFLQSCTVIVGAVEDAQNLIEGERDEVSGALRIGIAQSFGTLHIIPLIEELRAAYPLLEIEVSLFDDYVDMVEVGLDLWITNLEQLPEGYVAQRLTYTRFVLVAAPSYLTQHSTPYTPQDLLAHNCLVYHSRQRDYSTWRFSQNNEELCVNVTGNYQVDLAEAVRNAAISGWGVAYLATYLLKDEFRKGELIQLLPDWEASQKMSFYAVYPSRKHKPKKLAVAIDFFKHRLGQYPYWDKSLKSSIRLY
ncbi:LysR family transcriptional regulator [Shewanella donghaensis]|uniref:LysR family transcriptional regulator n=1 Tax=Shewanella donghaensis TaxID=238836 RepID=UPI00118303BC|nr:LysR family transcriptional regulator [Shewanella donghaensis]